MPAVTADTLTLPRLPELPVAQTSWRPVTQVENGQHLLEGEGFPVRRPFPSPRLAQLDPFIMLDHMGAVEYAPGEAKGTPWHPHRGFETVTYIMDGAFEHTDTVGGGGLIKDGSTQWMTAASGLQHIEKPPEALVRSGGLFHGVQLWVNLPAANKMMNPKYQDIEANEVTLLSNADGGALVRIIAGDVAGHKGPGSTFSPITLIHATISPGAQLTIPWRADFTAAAYVFAGRGTVGAQQRKLEDGQLAVFGKGDAVTLRAAESQPQASANGWEVLLLGGKPINEPIARYGPFVMNTKREIIQALDDFEAGRFGNIPAIPHRTSADTR
jgi:redox-sensitive bicupin YhaK (pirin superfamily)